MKKYNSKIVDCETCGTKFLSVTTMEHPTECGVCRGATFINGEVE